MQRLDLTLKTPAENLALDEALLDSAEEIGRDEEFLRLWESPHTMVVVGRSSRVHQEVNEQACRQRGIPILRRSSGGAAIVAGPGCLMYSLVLCHRTRPELRDIGRAHALILDRLVAALGLALAQAGKISRAGTSDLALCGRSQPSRVRKFSGNSLRIKRTHLLYHGTLLYAFDLDLIESCLKMPPRQPDYRHARPHRDFIVNLPIDRPQIVAALDAAWPTDGERPDYPKLRVDELVGDRFSKDRWNYEFT
jgi:lipoate-protein ligase A